MSSNESVWVMGAASDAKLVTQQMIEAHTAKFLADGGKINLDGKSPEYCGVPGGEKARVRATAKQRAEAEAKVVAHWPVMREMHLAGATLTALKNKTTLSVASVKMALYQRGEEVSLNSNTLSSATVARLEQAGAEGMTADEASRFAGVSLAEARGAARDYRFQYRIPEKVRA